MKRCCGFLGEVGALSHFHPPCWTPRAFLYLCTCGPPPPPPRCRVGAHSDAQAAAWNGVPLRDRDADLRLCVQPSRVGAGGDPPLTPPHCLPLTHPAPQHLPPPLYSAAPAPTSARAPPRPPFQPQHHATSSASCPQPRCCHACPRDPLCATAFSSPILILPISLHCKPRLPPHWGPWRRLPLSQLSALPQRLSSPLTASPETLRRELGVRRWEPGSALSSSSLFSALLTCGLLPLAAIAAPPLPGLELRRVPSASCPARLPTRGTSPRRGCPLSAHSNRTGLSRVASQPRTGASGALGPQGLQEDRCQSCW